MRDHPLLKAILAECYIIFLGLCAGHLFPYLASLHINPGPAFGVTAFLSAFVFSAATMGYLFLSSPLLLAIDGKPKEAAVYFIQTLLYFALAAAVSLALLFILNV